MPGLVPKASTPPQCGPTATCTVPVAMPFWEKPPMISRGCHRLGSTSVNRFEELTTSGLLTGAYLGAL